MFQMINADFSTREVRNGEMKVAFMKLFRSEADSDKITTIVRLNRTAADLFCYFPHRCGLFTADGNGQTLFLVCPIGTSKVKVMVTLQNMEGDFIILC